LLRTIETERHLTGKSAAGIAVLRDEKNREEGNENGA
jgi:hypothetical protein